MAATLRNWRRTRENPVRTIADEGDTSKHTVTTIGLDLAKSVLQAREIGACGHQVRMIPPIYVKACVKRGKTDAETISIATSS